VRRASVRISCRDRSDASARASSEEPANSDGSERPSAWHPAHLVSRSIAAISQDKVVVSHVRARTRQASAPCLGAVVRPDLRASLACLGLVMVASAGLVTDQRRAVAHEIQRRRGFLVSVKEERVGPWVILDRATGIRRSDRGPTAAAYVFGFGRKARRHPSRDRRLCPSRALTDGQSRLTDWSRGSSKGP